jgi:hypothetical protein
MVTGYSHYMLIRRCIYTVLPVKYFLVVIIYIQFSTVAPKETTLNGKKRDEGTVA